MGPLIKKYLARLKSLHFSDKENSEFFNSIRNKAGEHSQRLQSKLIDGEQVEPAPAEPDLVQVH